MNKEDIQERIDILEYEDFKFFPQQYINELIKTPNEMVSYKRLLQSADLDEDSIEYLVDLLVSNIQENQRFQRVASIKLLKQIIKRYDVKGKFQPSLTRKLFYLYENFIFSTNEEIQWAVSVFVKDAVLDDEDISWLIDNYEESEHIINRLLRYPSCNTKISEWAERVYRDGELFDRQSEVVAILISDSCQVPDYVAVSSEILMWAIYYSKCDNRTKEELMLSHLDFNNYAGALEVAERLNISSVAGTLLSHYRELASK